MILCLELVCRRLRKQTPSEQTRASVFCLPELMRCYLVSRAHGERAACTLHIHSPATPETPERPPSTLHQSGEEDLALTGKAAPVEQTRHVHCLRLWLFFCVCRLCKNPGIGMKYVKFSDVAHSCVIVRKVFFAASTLWTPLGEI